MAEIHQEGLELELVLTLIHPNPKLIKDKYLIKPLKSGILVVMTNKTLAQDYFFRARIRAKALYTLRDEGGYADVIRESQELVELLLKGKLRELGIEPPHWHDVSQLLVDHKTRLSNDYQNNLDRISSISRRLRKERELSYYGDEDYIPSDSYTLQDANDCISDCEWLLSLL